MPVRKSTTSVATASEQAAVPAQPSNPPASHAASWTLDGKSLTELNVQPGDCDSMLGLIAEWAPDRIFAKAVKEGSWAFQHGLRTGSELCLLNGEAVSEMTRERFVSHLKARPLRISFKAPADAAHPVHESGYPASSGSSNDRRLIQQAPVPTHPASSGRSYRDRRRSAPAAPDSPPPLAQEVTTSASVAPASPPAASPAPATPASPLPASSVQVTCTDGGNSSHSSTLPPGPPPCPPRARAQLVARRSCIASFGGGRTGKIAGHHSFADDEDAVTGVAATPLAEVSQPEEEALEAGPLNVTTRLEYTSLKADEAYNVFGLVTLQAAEAETKADLPGAQAQADELASAASATAPKEKPKQEQDDERAPVDVTCVLDVSGSMTGAKIQLLKDAVMFVISELSARDRLSIVTFQSDAERHIPLMRMTDIGKDAARQATMRLVAGGGTDIAAGLDCGIAVMEQRRQRNPVGALFLLTDGQDRGVQRHIPGLVARARAAQSAIYTFGFGRDHDASTMSCIAETAQTPFTFVEKLENISEAFAGAVSGIMSVVAQNIDLTIEPIGGSEIVALHTHFAQQHREGGAITVSIPDAFEGERRDVVVELRVPAANAGISGAVLRSRASYRAVRDRGLLVTTPPVLLEVTRCEEPEQEPDEEVVAQKERVQVADALESAISRGEEGNFEDARSVLEAQVQKLQSKRAPTENSKALLSEVQDAQRRLSSASSWSRGGKAEVADRAKMHKFQRCTNLYEAEDSLSACVEFSSKSRYTTSKQKSAVRRSKGEESW